LTYHLETELECLQTELNDRTYHPGEYHTFRIFDPKPRMISAAPYRDRVVHHALCNVIIPPIERTFIRDSYANRTGFGSHRALRRFTEFARTHRYILQCDIRQYFPSIDRAILKTMLRRKIKCPETLWLIDTIVDNSNAQEPVFHNYFPGDELLTPITRPHGLPIGNLTSQFFANFYLSGFDRFVKERLNIGAYLRYVDDFALFSDDRSQLVTARLAIENYNPRNCRSATRNNNNPDNRNNNIGFRVICEIPSTLLYQNQQVGICRACQKKSPDPF
jgi:retron-type reverse transcriptase